MAIVGVSTPQVALIQRHPGAKTQLRVGLVPRPAGQPVQVALPVLVELAHAARVAEDEADVVEADAEVHELDGEDGDHDVESEEVGGVHEGRAVAEELEGAAVEVEEVGVDLGIVEAGEEARHREDGPAGGLVGR